MRRAFAIAAWAAVGALPSPDVLGAPPAPPPTIVAWPAGPLEVRAASGRPFGPGIDRALVGKTIPFGILSKGGATPLAETYGALRIAAARLVDDGRTLVLATDPHPREATYLLILPGVPGGSPLGVLAYDLAGAEVTWEGNGGQAGGAEGAKWLGWWPSVDSEEARTWTAASAEHGRLLAMMAGPGRLTVRTFVALPRGKATVRIEADGPFEATLSNEEPKSSDLPGGRRRAAWELESTGESVELAATFPTGVAGKAPSFRVSYQSGSGSGPGPDAGERPLSRAWQSLPWAPPPSPSPTSAAPPPLPLSLAGGDWRRGEAIFFGEEAKCSSCHKVRGRGGEVGPDLGDRVGRDPAEVYRDVADPSAVIGAEYLPYTVALKDGRVAVGVVRAEGADAIRVLDTNGKATVVPRAEIEELRPSGTSIMPVGLAGALGEARMRDLMTFLLGRPPAP